MSAHVGPECRSCKGGADTGRRGLGIFCDECWGAIPVGRREEISRASTALGRHPTRREVRQRFDAAVMQGTRLARQELGLAPASNR